MNYAWLNNPARTFLNAGYLPDGMTAEQRVRFMAEAAEDILQEPGFADIFEAYMSAGFYSLSSPVWANFGNDRGLPISCNGSYIPDDIGGIVGKAAEVGVETKHGAGTSGYFGDIRPRGSQIHTGGDADGPVHFMSLFENMTDIVSQGNVRRGSFAAYLDIEHRDFNEFMQIREVGNGIQNMSIGVCISDDFMERVIADGEAAKAGTIKASESVPLQRMARVIRKRNESGYPYIFFTDTVNKNKPQVLKDQDRRIHASNLCSEIALPSNEDESFVCNLASMNCDTYDHWKHTAAVQVLTRFLDAVMTEYIEKTSEIDHMEAPCNFAERWRAIGIGQLGWHSYLQRNGIPFESFIAHSLAAEISQVIDQRSLEASKDLARQYGEPEGLKGYGVRNLTRTAIAPTVSSSFILGQVSPSIEPLRSNYFVKDLAKGQFTFKNPALQRVLSDHDQDNRETWNSILKHGGSVQHLHFLTDREKAVFKTFDEISPLSIIQQAAARQYHVDQSQSLNLLIPPDTPAKEINALIIEAWRLGVKTLYYQRSSNPAQNMVRDIMNCSACEA